MRPYRLIPMRDLISMMDEEEIVAGLRHFVCGRDPDRVDFLQNKAILFEKKGMARTYLAFMDDKIVGYFTLSIRCLHIPEDQDVSKTMSKKLNVDPDNNVAQSYLLGQLAKATGTYDGLGAELLEDAVNIIKKANRLVGCRVIRVDCDNNLIKYYTDHRFKYLCTTKATESKPAINQMVQTI